MWIRGEKGRLYNLDYAHFIDIVTAPDPSPGPRDTASPDTTQIDNDEPVAYHIIARHDPSAEAMHLTEYKTLSEAEAVMRRICQAIQGGETFLDLSKPPPSSQMKPF